MSCSEKSVQNPFDKNNCLTGTYGDFTVTVTINGDSVTVTPDHPDGYSVTFSPDGSKVSFDGLKFESDTKDLSKFYPLYEMARGINTTFTENAVTHTDGYIFKDFK